MVLIRECEKLFWGLTLEAGRKYSQTVNKTFHISMAAVDLNSAFTSPFAQVWVTYENNDYLLCTVDHKNTNQALDINFGKGEHVTISLTGTASVHLTGYNLQDDSDETESFDAEFEDEAADNEFLEGSDSDSDVPQLTSINDDDEDDEEDEDWDPSFLGKKRKANNSKLSSPKKMKIRDEVLDVDSSIVDSDLEEDDEEEDDDEELSWDESEFFPSEQGFKLSPKGKKSNEETPASANKKKKKKKPKAEIKPEAVNVEINGAGDASEGKKKKKKKKKKNKDNTNQESQQEEQKQKNKEGVVKTEASTPKPTRQVVVKPEASTPKPTPQVVVKSEASTPKPTPQVGKQRKVAGGTVVEDIKIGHGPEAKPGKMAHMYYVGKLAKNNKQFDSLTKGKPFKFRIGRGEVIKGWDTGVIGMKVGGKRTIIVPPGQGYGNERQGPIPPGSTLSFEVELKAVS